MNCEYCPSAELRDLLAALDAGELTCEQDSRLQQLVAEDLTARRSYIEFVFLFGTLRRLHSQQFDATPAQAPAAVSPVLGFLNNTWQQGAGLLSNTTFLSLLIAGVVIGSILGVLAILPMPTYEQSRFNHAYNTSGTGFQPVDGDRDKDGKFNFVARITGLHNCRWSANYLPPLRYAHLGIGRELKLDSGMVKITYKTGANIILEGPVEFTVEKPNACRLDLGKLTAKVSEPAVGFTVETPTATIVDLGTEFGVTAEQSGSTEVHIFIGEVEVQRPGRNGAVATVQRLKAGQAVRIDERDGSGLQAIELNERRFICEMSLAAIAKRAASSAVAASTFDLDTEGWTVTVGGSSLVHHATGGASGGYIQTGDVAKDDFFYFIAPEAFHGDRSRAYRSHLAFDLWTSYIGKPENKSMLKGTDAVVITGGGKSIAAGVPVLPKLDEWTHYSIPLCGLGHWRRVDRPDSPPASEQDILDVLSDIEDLRIRGEFMGGKDTAGLDNVVLQRVK